MADTNGKKNQENPKIEKSNEQPSGGGVLKWIIMAVVVVVCAGAGFGLGRLLAGSGKNETPSPAQESSLTQEKTAKTDNNSATASENQTSWYHDLEPILTNLNVPGATRYVRVALTLEISPEVKEEEGKKLFEQKKPVLANLLTIYFKGLKLEDISSDKDMRRIQYQILDALNEELFPDAKPQVKKILFKEFAIQ